MRPIMLHIPIIARYAWALPATLAGLLLSLIAFALGDQGFGQIDIQILFRQIILRIAYHALKNFSGATIIP